MRESISVQAYEAAERELFATRSRQLWRRHAGVFAGVTAAVIALDVLGVGSSWLVYLVLAGWALALVLHYRHSVRYGDAHLREQQVRIEWRAGRSNERLVPRSS